MNKQSEKKISHSLSLINREKLSIDGVENVISFDENSIILQTSLGELNIDGEGLKVVKLSVEDGEVALEGKIFGIFYIDSARKKRGGFFGKKNNG